MSSSKHTQEERPSHCERSNFTTKEDLTTMTVAPEKPSKSLAKLARPRKQSNTTNIAIGKPSMRLDNTKSKQYSWNPKATLIHYTTAPLTSRISKPPLASTNERQPRPLQELPLQKHEAIILEDLLYVLMGYEGQYIRFAESYDSSSERDRLAGPNFTILPGLNVSLQDLTTKMLKMATYYMAIESFLEIQGEREYGSMNHALCAAIRKHLQSYLVMVVQLETQFLTNLDFTLNVLNLHTLAASHMLFQIYSLGREILKQNAILEEDSDGDVDDFDNILESLRTGEDLSKGVAMNKRLCIGGNVLRLLTTRLDRMSGDPAARAILTSLLKEASRPYMLMLNEWLHYGIIKDLHGEFLIKEQKSIGREKLEDDYTDEYWDRRYTLRDEVPPQLEAFKNKVLLAGKYLNVVRECGGIDSNKTLQNLPQSFSFDDIRFSENINNAYTHANESLLKLLLTTHELPARLRSLKRYFMLERSHLFISFLELGASEFRKPIDKINMSKVESLLDLVLHQPGTAQDAFKEDLRVEMNSTSLIDSLNRVVSISGMEQGEALEVHTAQQSESERIPIGFTSLQLNCSVPFPVSLVISRKTIWRYQVLFRFLLSLRYLERQLLGSWQSQNKGIRWSHKTSNNEVEYWKRRVFVLRARMLVFVQQLLSFCTSEVIEPNWQILMAKLESDGSSDSRPAVSTVDELMQDHVNFLDTCLKECMLTNSKLLRRHTKLLQTCTHFASCTGRLSKELEKLDPDLTGSKRPATMCKLQWAHFQTEKSRSSSEHSASTIGERPPLDKLRDLMDKFEYSFGKGLQGFIDALNHFAATETVGFLGLCARLSTVNQGTVFSGLRNEEGVED
ncbi:spindle pole body component alp4 [Sclerotinia borealis F-4128]|uniref:Spindle pole body component n=1 Tax=Sclerotinia borealis (strain F-4128) TaxID=1432307 RepID=W9CH91_SCLBF|nr:spindle pole body component alp4 [Sclerotinia borealis F-4128]